LQAQIQLGAYKADRKKKRLPVSVEWAGDIKSSGARFVVRSRAKSIHKAAVGKRSLLK